MTMKALGQNLTSGWKTTLMKALENYNGNYHSTIKTSPDSIMEMDADDDEIDEIKKRIEKRAIRHGDIDKGVYKVGDYVRIKIYKATKLGPKYTFKGGLSKIVDKDYQDKFEGVFVIHSVSLGKNSEKGSKQTTYGIVSNWAHESKIGSLPSGQTKARAGVRIAIKQTPLLDYTGETQYPTAAYQRHFTKSALSRVPQDSKGRPVAEKPGEFEVASILAERKASEDKTVTEYEVKWKGYDDTTWEPRENVEDSEAFDTYLKKKKKRK